MARRCPSSLSALTVVLCGAVALPAQSTRVQDLGIGKVLVTQRDSRDPTFAEKVILLVHYDHDGTVGLAINRPTNVAISAALEDFEGTKGRTDPVFVGGPVDVKSVLALLQASATPQGATHVTGKVHLVSTKVLLEKTFAERHGPGDLRVYLGYCGWAPGQLENETGLGFWHIFDGNADLVFDSEPDTLWSRLIARAGQHIAQGRVPRINWIEPIYHYFDQPFDHSFDQPTR